MLQNALLVALSAFGLVVAQQQQNLTVDTRQIGPAERGAWCRSQQNVCDNLCARRASRNDCNTADLNYSCLCQNGSTPGLQYYLDSMPTHLCMAAFSQCATRNAGTTDGSLLGCTTNIKEHCGTMDSSKVDTSTPSSPSASSASHTPTNAASTAAASAAASNTPNTAASAHAALLGKVMVLVAAGALAVALL